MAGPAPKSIWAKPQASLASAASLRRVGRWGPRHFFGGGKKVTRGIEMQPIQRDAELRSAPPYNNGFEQSARGRHSPCLRKACAGALRPAMAGLRPCSLLNPALYGRNQSQELKRSMQSGKELNGLRLGESNARSGQSQTRNTALAVCKERL